jgi:hypothetical protein
MSLYLLIIICIISVGGIIYVYKNYNDADTLKKAMVVMLALILIMMTFFMVIDIKTRDIAMAQGENQQATLAILLGWTRGGYSPYYPQTWGGTGPDDDFDRDGIPNKIDNDADGDGILDSREMPTRFNPYQPDIGIEDIKVMWIDEETLKIKVTPVTQITDTNHRVKLYINDETHSTKQFYTEVTFTVNNAQFTNKIELVSEGEESDYANKANNVRTYTIVEGVAGVVFGQWYSDMENTLQGWIRNSPMFYATNQFSYLENLFREKIANLPLMLWMVVLTVVIILLIIYVRRKTKGKKRRSLKDILKRKPKYEEGTTRIKVY